MADYLIFKEGNFKAVKEILIFINPNCIKYTIIDTLDKDTEEIENRIQIINRIIKQNPFIFDLYLELDPESPLLEEKVHVDLLKTLIQNGANMRGALNNRKNLVSVAVQGNMNESQFHSLSSFLINDHKVYDLFRKNISWICPVFDILRSKSFVYFETLKMIFNIPGFDITQTIAETEEKTKMTYNLTLFQFANYYGKGVNVLKLMIEMGADYMSSYAEDRTNLILAIGCLDYEAVDFLMSLGFSLNEKNQKENTAILFAGRYSKMIEYLVSKGADIYSTNEDGVSVLHCSAGLAASDEFSEIVTYLREHAPELLNKKSTDGLTPLAIRKLKHPGDHIGIKLLEKVLVDMESLTQTPPEVDEYKIYQNGDLQAVREITTFTDPNCIKYTIIGTLDKDDDDIKIRVRMICHIFEFSPFILDSYLKLDPKSPLLETKVHVNLLKALVDNGTNFRVASESSLNLLSVAVRSNMNESQYHSLCSYLINEWKAYDLFSNREKRTKNLNDTNELTWICPVVSMMHSTEFNYFQSLKMIFNITGFKINQTGPIYMGTEEGTWHLTLFQIANRAQKGVVVYKLMIQNGADYKLNFPFERTNLMVAVGCGDLSAVKYYKSLGFSLNYEDSNGATPMMYLCKDLNMIKHVKSLGGDILKVDKDGKSVFHYSAKLVDCDSFSEFVMYFSEKHVKFLI